MRPAPAGPPGPPDPQGPQGPTEPARNGDSSTDYSSTWNPQEVGYFDPFYDSKTTATGGPMEHAGKDT